MCSSDLRFSWDALRPRSVHPCTVRGLFISWHHLIQNPAPLVLKIPADMRRDVAALAALLVLILAAMWPAVSRPELVFSGHDFNQLFNWETATRDALSQGAFPFWNPYLLSGMPHFADFQTGVLYPVSAILRWLPIPAF